MISVLEFGKKIFGLKLLKLPYLGKSFFLFCSRKLCSPEEFEEKLDDDLIVSGLFLCNVFAKRWKGFYSILFNVPFRFGFGSR